MYRLLIVALSLVLLSCASQTPVPESGTTALQAKPGITQSLDGQKIWEKYDCSNKKLPFIVIEENKIQPTSVQAGKEIQHHFVYAACTSSDQRVINGTLNRKIYYRGRVMFQDTTRNFAIIPGQWNVNAVIAIPPKVQPGNYDFELTLISPTMTVKGNLTFVVRK